VAKEVEVRRFGPERWVTVRETGEHVQVEAWSPIKFAYRVRSRKNGRFLAADAELEDVPVHPEAARGRHWNRCPVVGCGAPLTPELATCERCNAPTCTCGRCRCLPGRSTSKKKAAAKSAAVST
jgi:hypothetical protein